MKPGKITAAIMALLAAFALAACLVGCGGEQAQQPADGQSAEPQQEDAAEAAVEETAVEEALPEQQVEVGGVSFTIPGDYVESTYGATDTSRRYEAAEDGALHAALTVDVYHGETYTGDTLALLAAAPFASLPDYYENVSAVEPVDVGGTEAYRVTADSTSRADMHNEAVTVVLDDGFVTFTSNTYDDYPGYPTALDVAQTMSM